MSRRNQNNDEKNDETQGGNAQGEQLAQGGQVEDDLAIKANDGETGPPKSDDDNNDETSDSGLTEGVQEGGVVYRDEPEGEGEPGDAGDEEKRRAAVGDPDESPDLPEPQDDAERDAVERVKAETVEDPIHRDGGEESE